MELYKEDLSAVTPNASKQKPKEQAYSFSHKLLYMILACVVLVVGTVATLLCRAQVRYLEQNILADHREIEQLWIDNTLESIRSWQTKSLESIRYVSQAEMFRLFAKDVEFLLNGNPEDLASIAEERDYLVDLLADTAARRGWQTARILSVKGQDVVAPKGLPPVRSEILDLLGRAKKERGAVYSGLYHDQGLILLDVVDPLYEVQSTEEPAIVGFLVTTLPMDELFQAFLAEEHMKDSSYTGKILAQGENCVKVVQLVGGKPALLSDCIAVPQSIPFDRRPSFGDKSVNAAEVYSLGSHFSLPPWYVVIECSASAIDAIKAKNAREIYLLGVVGSLAVALFFAMILGTWIVRHKAKEEQKCIGGLVHAIECALDGSDAKFRYLQGRSQKVARLSSRLGKLMKLSGQAMENIQLAARLSQVGKIFVPRDIMIKRGLLTDEERRQVQLAPYHAYNVLKGVLPKRVARIVYQMGGKVVDNPETGANHELTVKEMLLEARVLLVANDFCAMVSQRGTRPPLPIADARKKLEGRALYDKMVVDAINSISDKEIKELLDAPLEEGDV
ncbi:MAG: hypothetical protein K5657_10120 [Desulfovibrio sp.]|nr:hypothetical protein [Desulfovibrio sp.]